MYTPGSPMSQEEIERENRMAELHEYYGVPLLLFSEDEESQRYKDWDEASTLIFLGKPIPKELEERLFQYKKSLVGK